MTVTLEHTFLVENLRRSLARMRELADTEPDVELRHFLRTEVAALADQVRRLDARL